MCDTLLHLFVSLLLEAKLNWICLFIFLAVFIRTISKCWVSYHLWNPLYLMLARPGETQASSSGDEPKKWLWLMLSSLDQRRRYWLRSWEAWIPASHLPPGTFEHCNWEAALEKSHALNFIVWKCGDTNKSPSLVKEHCENHTKGYLKESVKMQSRIQEETHSCFCSFWCN